MESYWLGRMLGPIILVILIGYIIVRIRKKRGPNAKEWGVIGGVAVLAFILGAVARVMQSMN